MVKGKIVHLKIVLISFLFPGFLSGVLPVTVDGPFLFIIFQPLPFADEVVLEFTAEDLNLY